MKKYLFAGLAILSGFVCNAQSFKSNDSFNQFLITYSPTQFVVKSDGSKDNETMNTFELEYGFAKQFSNSLPLGIYFGAAPSFSYKNKSESVAGHTANAFSYFFTLKLNLGLVGEFDISDNFAIRPYLGFVPMAHLAAGSKTKFDGKVQSDMDLLSKKEMGDNKYNWFVLDWKVGMTFKFKDLLLSYHYEAPITNLYKKDNTKINLYYHNISLGFNF